MDAQQKSHMKDRIHNIQSTLDAHLNTVEDHKKILEEVLQKKGDILDVDFGARLQVETIKNSIAEREEEIKKLRMELGKYEVALQRNEYID